MAAFLAPSLPPSRPSSLSSSLLVLTACSLPRAGLRAGSGEEGADSDTVFGPLGVSVFNDGRDKVAGPQGPSVCLETQEEAPSVEQSDCLEGCG